MDSVHIRNQEYGVREVRNRILYVIRYCECTYRKDLKISHAAALFLNKTRTLKRFFSDPEYSV